VTIAQLKKKKLPDVPGVYFFLGRGRKILYIGKAASLRSRVRSYFSKDLGQTRGAQIVRMVDKARTVDFRQTDSVLEALILEANLIKAHKPRYNTDEKDDKSFNYVVITKEKYPRIILVRGKELEDKFPSRARRSLFGPFPHGMQLKEALKLIRKIFPFHDTCIAGEDMEALGKKSRPCFNRQIGLCPGVCTGEISSKEYLRTIRHLELLFQGKKKSLLKTLEREMRAHAKEQEFELAAKRRREIRALQHVEDVSLIKDEYRTHRGGEGYRIEAYDVAHLGGSAMVGVMTVVEGSEAKKAAYRKFRIRSVSRSNDTAALAEILTRRLAHDEWRMPNLIVVDGASAQINMTERTLEKYGVKIPIVGVVKDEKHRPKDIRGAQEVIQGREREILLANGEAHRFAIGWHRQRSRRGLLR
jgi:excinuclease ABC subunit C